jgi:hypothetical protein
MDSVAECKRSPEEIQRILLREEARRLKANEYRRKYYKRMMESSEEYREKIREYGITNYYRKKERMEQAGIAPKNKVGRPSKNKN